MSFVRGSRYFTYHSRVIFHFVVERPAFVDHVRTFFLLVVQREERLSRMKGSIRRKHDQGERTPKN